MDGAAPPTRVDPTAIRAHVEATCPGVRVSEDEAGALFFIYDPRGDLPPQRQVPFATVVTSDRYEGASDLERRGLFRLNMGVAPETYRAMFGPPPPFPKDGGIAQTGHDYSVPDTLVPHPIYAAMGWVCVIDPYTTWPQAKRLLAEAYEVARRKGHA